MTTMLEEKPVVEEQERELAASQPLNLRRQDTRRQDRRIKTAVMATLGFAIVAVIVGMLLIMLGPVRHSIKASAVSAPAVSAPAASKPAVAAVPTGPVAVSLREFVVAPSRTAARAGKVTFNVRNGGKITHEFVVIRTNKPAANLLRGARADETGNVGETGDLAAGASKRLTLRLTPGHYALICNLPGHYRLGQHVDFTVK
jgi:uncharacterized cupredoxin-like copper-binding protein